MNYDLIVIGGGPAGYVAAIRGAQLGKSVACVEMDRAGGTCLNWGCIPTKALLKNAHHYHLMKHRAEEFGMKFEGLSYDWDKVINRSRNVSDKLAGGIEYLFKKNKIDYLRGYGSIPEPGQVSVKGEDGKEQTYTAANIIVATGCKSRELPGLPFDGKRVISSKEAMVLPKQPKSMVIIGAGAIGVEFGYIYNAFGTKVTIVEMQDHMLPVEDAEVGKTLQKSFEKDGITCLTSTKTTKSEVTTKGVKLTVEGKKGEETIEADVCLVAIGVAPVLPGGIELKLEKGFIATDGRYQTSVKGVYAIGDIDGPPWLAHTAMFEAVQCVDGMFVEGHQPRRVERFPGCTYCYPEVASVGKTEQALKDEGVEFKVGKFPYMALGKAQASGETEGFVKLIFGKKYGELLGAHIIGENATDLISEMGLALEMEATADDLHATIHAHPTLAEAIHEATLAADNHALHI